MTRVFLVDDHPIVRQGLRTLIQGATDLSVVGEAGDVPTAAARLASLLPEVAIVDLNLGGGPGLELVHICRGLNPAPACVVLTMHREESIFYAALGQGVAAFVLKENATEDVLLAVRAVAAGGFFISNGLREFLGRRNAQVGSDAGSSRLSGLTPTERRVLRLISANRTTKEIAHELCVSPRTVDSHRGNICERLGLHGAQALLRFALEQRSTL
jgi:DNA-binding NarL/FixJ family response regulator